MEDMEFEINEELIKSATYNKETGVSEVTIETNYGDFTGFAKIHPDDEWRVSRFAGCNIAAVKAFIKCFRHIKELNPQLKNEANRAIRNAYKVLATVDNRNEELYLKMRNKLRG